MPKWKNFQVANVSEKSKTIDDSLKNYMKKKRNSKKNEHIKDTA